MSKTDISTLLPPLKPSGPLLVGDGDVLIAAGGFEDRALAAARNVIKAGHAQALLITYQPENERNRSDELASLLREKGLVLEDKDFITFDRFDPELFQTDLKERLSALQARMVFLDISAMSKLAILLCLDLCFDLNLDTSVFYSEAISYCPSQEEYEKAKGEDNLHQPSIQIYTGVHGVHRVTRLSSVAMQGQPSAAIVFMSFNELLTQALLNTVYPSRLFLINGRPPELSWREEATAWIHEQLRKEWPSVDNPVSRRENGEVKEIPERVVSTLEYSETVRSLINLYWELAIDHRILLAPTGSKMQTVGCFIAKALHPDIHIEYPTPEGFLQTYSAGIGQTWLIEFGMLGDLISRLRNIERESHLGLTFEEAGEE